MKAKPKANKELIAEQKQKRQQQQLELEQLKTSAKQNRWLALIVAAVGVLLYLNTLHHGFVLDDYSVILENRITKQGIKALPEIFSSSYRSGYYLSTDELYRPIPKALFAVSWDWFGNNPMPLHLLNILLYGLTGWVVFYFCIKIFSNRLFAFATSLLYIVHPLHTEVVANIKSVDEILSFLLCVTASLFLLDYIASKNVKKLTGAVVSFFIALFCKESSITFLAVFPLLFFIHQQQPASIHTTASSKKDKGKIWAVIYFAIAAFIFLAIRHSILSKIPQGDPSIADNLLMAAKSSSQRFATAVLILGMYLKLIFIPHPLIFDYSFNQIPIIGLDDMGFMVSLVLHVAMLFWAFWQWNKNRLVSFSIFFYFITISIYSNIFYIIGSSFGERFLYTSSFGVCLLAGFYLSKLNASTHYPSLSLFFQKNLKPLAILLPVLLAFSAKTIARNPVWQSNYTLYSNDVKLAPNSTRTHYYYGNLLAKDDFLRGKTDKEKDSIQQLALSELQQSVAIFPFSDAYNQMGIIYDKRKEYQKSLESYQNAIKANNTDPIVYNNLGSLYFNMGKIVSARESYEKAVSLNPNYAEAYMNLGSTFGMMQQYDEALNHFFKAIKLDPNFAQAYYFAGLTYRFKGDESNAQSYLNKAAQLDPEKYSKTQ
jgi:tetratricopeptide (TPR) repeat protein